MLDKLNVVVLDGLTLNDIRWEGYDQFASFVRYDVTAPDQVVERAQDADIILANKVRIGEQILEKLPRLRYIGVLATGYDNIDLEAAKRHGVTVTNVPGYAGYSVAQLVFALVLELTYRVGLHTQTVVQDKKWSGYPAYSYWEFPLHELSGKTMGIIGMGRIGERVGVIAGAFGMNVVAYNARPHPVTGIDRFEWVSFERLLEVSDVVSLHCPLFESTRGMMDREAFARMKPSALLINTSRGGLIVESDLRRALDDGIIAGAGLDVLSAEPPAHDNVLFGAKNLVITPHLAWATVEARERLVGVALDNIECFLSGQAVNVVNA